MDGGMYIHNEMEEVQYLDVPVKSQNDKKLYRTLKMKNGITALLVSDTDENGCYSSEQHVSEYEDDDDNETDDNDDDDDDNSTGGSSDEDESDSDSDSEQGDVKLAACALLVDVGSFSDPFEIQGLAHFLEHMIFMGSEKYPKENAFDAHIKRCGGFDNANTECEETNFYFEVGEKHLNSSVDRFVALFEAPLLKKEAMTRERDAVESEFQSTLHDDEARRDQLLAALAAPKHPCGVFTWGNHKSLKDNIDDESLHKKLQEFRKRHYSSDRMYVVLQGKLSLEDLEKICVKNFSRIPPSNGSPDDFSSFNHQNAFNPEFHEKVFFVKSVKSVSKLELTWCLPSVIGEYHTKPDHFLGSILGYEGAGSLCAYLRKRLWALDIIAGIGDSGFDSNSMYSLFNICILLTEEGFSHLEEVLGVTFGFLKLLRNSTHFEDLYKELQYIESVNFQYQIQRAAMENVQDLAINMKYYPPKDILTGSDLYFNYDQEVIERFVSYLLEFNFNLMISSDKEYNGLKFDKKEQWFGTDYTSIEMPTKWKTLWEQSEPIPELYLPLPNVFIAKDFRILWKDLGMPALPSYPTKIFDSEICELWYRMDDKFLLPHAYMYFYFMTPMALNSAKNSLLAALYSDLVNYTLAEQLYPATVAGLCYSCYCSDKGIVLKINGYNEKTALIFEVITRTMMNMKDHVTEEILNTFIVQQRRKYNNFLIKPKSLNTEIRLELVENVRWPRVEKYNLLNTICLNDMKEFCQSIFDELKIQALIQGNVTKVMVSNIMKTIQHTFNSKEIQNKELMLSRTRQLPLGSNYVICKALNECDVNTAVCNFYQIGPNSIRTECIMDLIAMFIEEPLFDRLRTQEQLGYDVSWTVRVNFAIIGYSISVNSQENKFTSEHVEQRIEEFRLGMVEILQQIDDDEYNHVRESLIKIKQTADSSLFCEVDRNWNEITSEDYLFDRHKTEVECLKTIEKVDVVQFLNKERENVRKLSIQIVGNQQSESVKNLPTECEDLKPVIELEYLENDKSTISNINEFKQKLTVYPLTKTLIDFPTRQV